MPVIAVENLKYRYPNTESLALDGLSFTVEKGEFIGIVGENGAGKSTLSQALIGLVPQFYKGAYGGRVLIEDLPAETTPISELCCKVGLVFQNPFNQLSGAKDNVYEEVAFGMQNLGVPREEMHRRAEEALKLLDIWQYRDRNPFDLSGGQMQRVAIASVLVMNPDILVLDEPTSQLDPQGSEEMFRYMYSYSPYHNIKPGTVYPKMYVQTGEMDNNVPPYHGKKFAVRMQHDADEQHPVLLQVLAHGSHDRGVGDEYYQNIAQMQTFIEICLAEEE